LSTSLYLKHLPESFQEFFLQRNDLKVDAHPILHLCKIFEFFLSKNIVTAHLISICSKSSLFIAAFLPMWLNYWKVLRVLQALAEWFVACGWQHG
jgi:hypothetical protein